MPWNRNDYPPDWEERRERILKRAGNCCEECKVENHTYRKGTLIVLTIAHLDHDKENWEVKDERLKALCQACHLRYDLGRHIANRKYGRNYRKNQYKLW